jgi:hypothetical protein
MREGSDHAPGRRRLLPVGRLGAPDVSRKEVTALTAVVLLLAIVPAAVSLSRPSTFHARANFVPVTRSATQTEAITSIRHQINVPFMRLYMEARMGRNWVTYRKRFNDITFTPGPSGRIVMTVPGATPKEAVKSAELIVPRLALQTNDVRRVFEAGIRRRRAIATQLKRGGLSAGARRRLKLQSLFILTTQKQILDKVPLIARGAVEGPRLGTVDRALQQLHAGDLPRAAPGWAALAGLLVGLALAGTWLTMRAGHEALPARPSSS